MGRASTGVATVLQTEQARSKLILAIHGFADFQKRKIVGVARQPNAALIAAFRFENSSLSEPMDNLGEIGNGDVRAVGDVLNLTDFTTTRNAGERFDGVAGGL